MTIKVNVRNLQLGLNELDLRNMAPKELEDYIKEHVCVSLIGNNSEKRFYVN